MRLRWATAFGGWTGRGSSGSMPGKLPLEELVFYFVTNIMAAQGFVMIAGFLRDRAARLEKQWRK